MTPAQLKKLDRQLTEYLASMTEGMGRLERRKSSPGPNADQLSPAV